MTIFLLTIFIVLALADLLYIKGMEVYSTKWGYDDEANKWLQRGFFGLFYVMLIVGLSYSTFPIMESVTILGVTVIWHLCGIEDFLFYLFEPLIPLWDRESTNNSRFLFWRFPESLYWLEKSPVLLFVCGLGIPLGRFLAFVFLILTTTLFILNCGI